MNHKTVSTYSKVYSRASAIDRAEALQREVSTPNQIRWDTETLLWGAKDDSLPMRIITAVNDSPTTISCLGTIEKFLAGSEFTDKGLMDMVIDDEGTTLFNLHLRLCIYYTLLDSFSVNFKYDYDGKITNTYLTGTETVRFVKQKPKSKDIKCVKVNPYFGTSEYNQDYNKTYPVFDLADVIIQMDSWLATYKEEFPGQIYFYGDPRPPYKFYPVPKYWSGDKWIYVDGQIQSYHKNNLDNGMFQSVLMTMVGDPNLPSKNPKYQTEVTGADGTKRKKSTATIGQEFDEQMSNNFSGVQKAGGTFVRWVNNKDNAVDIQNFPVNSNFETTSGLFTDAIRGITIATEVPAILANLPQQASSLGSDGNAMKVAIELMQSKVSSRQRILEDFYNKVLLPNRQETTGAQVKIKNYVPITTQVEVPDKIWEWMNDAEKSDFVTNNVPGVKVIRPAVVPGAPVTPGLPGETETQAQINEALKGLKVSEINRITSITNQVKSGKLTDQQGRLILQGYGLTDEQINAWLTPTV